MYKRRIEAREQRLKQRLDALPLRSRRPRLTERAIALMSGRLAIYSPAELEAADARASAYDAIWGFCGDAELAGYLDMERVRAEKRKPSRADP